MKYIKYILLAFVLIVFSVQGVVAQVGYQESVVYTVKMGDTAYSIATAHNLKVEDIYRLNPGVENGIKAGQEIKLPAAKEAQQSINGTANNSNLQTHEIVAKETLYSVSQKYGTTVYELLRVNPGLSESTFNIGRVINIPTGTPVEVVEVSPSQVDAVFAKSTLFRHTVGKKETLYSISKKYNCSIDDILRLNPSVKDTGLKEGSVIVVPSSSATLNKVQDLDPNVFYPRDGIVRIALLLPFKEGSKSVTKEKIEEYYEGFLLALQKMKEQGLNAEVYTFDIGTDTDTRRLESVLGTSELNDLNLIIGGVSDRQVKLISNFSQRTGTNYVVPFNNKATGIELNRSEFQVANSPSNLFPKVGRYISDKFKDHNIIFLSELSSDKSKKDFVKTLQDELQAKGIQYKTASATASITDVLTTVVDSKKKNIIIPSSPSEAGLKRILDGLDTLTKEESINVSLLGYPEWQTYINLMPRMHRYNTYFYSVFYLDTKSPAAQIFSDKYKRWFNKPLLIAYPKFAHMGYDTGLVFLTGLQKYGHRFATYINDLGVKTLQSALYFEPATSNGGYINTGIYLVNLRPDNSVEKIEIK